MTMQPRTLFPMGNAPLPNSLEGNARLRATLAAHEATNAALKDDNRTLHELHADARTTHEPEGKPRPSGDQRLGRHEVAEKERLAMTRGKKKPVLYTDEDTAHFAMGSACLHAMNAAKGANECTGRRKAADGIMDFGTAVHDGEVLGSLLQKNADNSKFDVVPDGAGRGSPWCFSDHHQHDARVGPCRASTTRPVCVLVCVHRSKEAFANGQIWESGVGG
jgi:hypothetical protein